MKTLVFEVVEIRGTCPVYKMGDKIVIIGPEIDLQETDALCIHTLASLLQYAVALREGVDPVKLGLSKEKYAAFIQCMDSGEPYTQGGIVVFRCKLRER
jgi:uncharacterized repeat protein (TIGR04076 family)